MIDSKKIRQFFEQNENNDGFWDAIHEGYVIDYDHWYEDNDADYFEDGYNFALDAKGKPVCRYATGQNAYYWVGSEDEVVKKLQDCWDDWLELHPPETEEEKQEATKQRKRTKIQQKLQKLQNELRDLD